MNNTYKVQQSNDRLIVGVSSQIQDFSRTQPITNKLFFYQNEAGRFDENIQFPIYRMESKAKLTDLVSNVPLVDNLMISHAFLEALKKMKLPAHQIFPLKFIYKGSIHEEYSAISIVKDVRFLEYISWKNSRFFKTTHWHKNIIESYSFNSLDELLKFKNEMAQAGFGLLPEIRLAYHNDFDIINFARYPMPLGFLCSEKAKNQINDSSFTGFDFVQLPEDTFVEIDKHHS